MYWGKTHCGCRGADRKGSDHVQDLESVTQRSHFGCLSTSPRAPHWKTPLILSALHIDRMPCAVVSNATRVWELNVHWTIYSQCGVWNAKGRGVDIWECIRDHDSTPGTEPPNAIYWRYITRR